MAEHKHIIKQISLRYKCKFCGKLFKTCSACAKHIERKSFLGIAFPADIEITEATLEENKNE